MRRLPTCDGVASVSRTIGGGVPAHSANSRFEVCFPPESTYDASITSVPADVPV